MQGNSRTVRRPLVRCMVVAGAVVLGRGVTHAAVTTPGCLAKKLKDEVTRLRALDPTLVPTVLSPGEWHRCSAR